ncbi:uncharacterized protein EDB93DRAFT_1116712 [Suillus bovinus]|uniref:uncharacterized protein n=1 Tax=Suillus bovinus TaxID=48563 RepID=UPI001B874A14|nr:uncharacterized protein EDB93DRAFT_1116712 [Suillus bovinus]KAG2158853.1 hypothetical protein EDB93DRAFT_1116712 [Suillus bovinus]
MEDRQPNEVRLDRKGKSTVPAITVTRRGGHRGSFRGFQNNSSRGRPPYRPNVLPHSTTSPAWNHSHKISSVSSLSVPGRSLDHVRQEPSDHLAQSNLRPPKRTKFNSQQFSSRESQSEDLPHNNTPLPSPCPKVILGDHEAQAVFSPYRTIRNDHSLPRKMSQAVQRDLPSGRAHAIRIESQYDKSAISTRDVVMGSTFGYGKETPKVSPCASGSTPGLSHLAKSSTPASSKAVLGSCSTHATIPQKKGSAIPGKQRALPSRVVSPLEEIIDLTVDPPDTHVIVPPPMSTRFFRSGVLKIKSVSSKAPSAGDITYAAESITLPDSDSDDIAPLRDLINRDGSMVAKLREEPAQVSSETLVNGPNEISSSVSALLLSSNPGPSRLTLDTHDKPRRVLSAHWNSSLIAVSMRGFVESLGMPNLVSQHNLRRPTAPTQESVDDACILHAGDTSVIVLAHAREEKQISYLTFQTSMGTKYRVVDRPWNRTKKAGASVVSTMMQPLMFASGGYDHAVHIWNFSPDFMGVSSTLLAIKHTSVIQSLLPVRDTSHKLISAGADCSVHLWDLSPERVVHTFKTSNSPYHAHKTESPFCTLLEVGHRDLQFELRDHRMVPEHPAERFGFFTTELHGRYIKGDTWSHFFASGSRNGVVRLWDLRNVREQLASVSCFSNEQVIQVLKTESDMLAFSKRGDVMTLNHK